VQRGGLDECVRVFHLEHGALVHVSQEEWESHDADATESEQASPALRPEFGEREGNQAQARSEASSRSVETDREGAHAGSDLLGDQYHGERADRRCRGAGHCLEGGELPTGLHPGGGCGGRDQQRERRQERFAPPGLVTPPGEEEGGDAGEAGDRQHEAHLAFGQSEAHAREGDGRGGVRGGKRREHPDRPHQDHEGPCGGIEPPEGKQHSKNPPDHPPNTTTPQPRSVF
jgi:hypothetical protein